jgi:16S rRNA G966 N2-methylase RsmD
MSSVSDAFLDSPLVRPHPSLCRRFLSFCSFCLLRDPSPPPSSSPSSLVELKDLNESRHFGPEVIVPVRDHSPPLSSDPDATPKKKKAKKKGLPVSNSLVEGFQVIGNGKETVIATMSKTQVEFNKTTFRSDIKKKPDYVPLKYWNQRYSIFSKFDDGVQLDEESWYSATHECIAKSIADRLKKYCVMDGFAGAGGNVIQFAMNNKTIALEIDESRLEMLENNAKIYEVSENIKFVKGDFLEVAKEEAPIDVIFMSPPWGGPDYVKSKKYDLFASITPDITKIMQVCNEVTKNVVLYLPRTAHPAQIVQLFKYMPNVARKIEFQLFCVGLKVKTIACYMGDFNDIDNGVIAKAVLEKMIKLPKYLPKERDEAIEAFAKEIVETGLNQAIIHAYSAKRHPRSK